MTINRKLFLSAVTSEFACYRHLLAADLQRPNLDVAVQERFVVTGGNTLEKIDAYIRQCDGVIHLIGKAAGAAPEEAAVAALLTRYPDFAAKLLPLAPHLAQTQPGFSYTQWEAYLAIYHKRPLFVYRPTDFELDALQVPRDPNFTFNAAEAQSQREHYGRISALGHDRGQFHNEERLSSAVLRDLVEILPRLEAGLDVPSKPCNLPYASLGKLFKGREGFLSELHGRILTTMDTDGRAKPVAITQTPRQAICGLGGIGKTRLAVEYALRHANDYKALLFVVADSPDHLKHGIADLALVLNLKEKDQQDDEARFTAALRWLMEHPGWCLILDNVDDESAATACENFVSKLYGGHVIITSRLTKWSMSGIEALDLDVLDASSARDLLLERTPHRFQTNRDREAAGELAKLLDGLALGLEQAGAYIDTVQCSIPEYVDLWRKGETEVTDWYDKELMERLMKYPKSVAVTWNATVQRIGPAAESLLHLLAVFAPAPIPVKVITGPAAKQAMEQFLKSQGEEAAPLSARALLTKLAAFSMVKKSADGAEQSLSLHRVVRDITWQRVAEDQRVIILETAAELFAVAAPRQADRYENWVAWRSLFPHAACIWEVLQHLPRKHWNYRLLHGMALFHMGQNNNKSGEALQRLSCELMEEQLGPDDSAALEAKNDLALLLNDPQEALKMLREALEGLEVAYRKDGLARTETRLLATVYNVALYSSDDVEAESLLRRCIAGFTASPEAGRNHWRTLLTSRQLAYLLWRTDRRPEAEALARHTLELSLGNPDLGPDHKDTLDSVRQIALFHVAKGELAEAEKQLRVELAGRERAAGLGPQHQSTLDTLKRLLDLLWQEKKRTAAEELGQTRVRLWRGALGNDHPNVLDCTNLLVRMLVLNGKIAEARQAEVECELALTRKHYYEMQARSGGEGKELLAAMGLLAGKLRDVGEREESESIYRRQIDGLKRQDDEDNRELAIALNNYGLLLRDLGKLDQALASYEEALRIQELRAAGARDYDPKVPHRLNNVSMVLLMLDRPEDAKARLARAWSLKQGHHDVTSARILWARLAGALLVQEPFGLFLGQLKGLVATRESRVSSQVDDYWNVQSVLARLKPRLSPEHGRLLESIVDALNAGSRYGIAQSTSTGAVTSVTAASKLDDLALWRTQEVVPLETPWPGTGADSSTSQALSE